MQRILIAVTSAVLCFPLAAQTEQTVDETTSREAKKRVVPAIKVGISRSNVYDRKGEAFVSDGKSGFAGGVALALPLGSLLGIQPEAMFLHKGFEGAGRIHGESYLINRTTTHLDIPVQVQFKPFSWLTFLAGPQWSFVLKRNDRYNEESNVAARRTMEESSLRENLFGTLIGFDLNFGHVVISGRSGWDVTQNNSDGSSGTPLYRNRWIIWTVGYRFY